MVVPNFMYLLTNNANIHNTVTRRVNTATHCTGQLAAAGGGTGRCHQIGATNMSWHGGGEASRAANEPSRSLKEKTPTYLIVIIVS